MLSSYGVYFFYIPPMKLCLSVSRSVHGEGLQVTIAHDAVDPTIWDPSTLSPSVSPSVQEPNQVEALATLVVVSGDQDWRPVQTS